METYPISFNSECVDVLGQLTYEQLEEIVRGSLSVMNQSNNNNNNNNKNRNKKNLPISIDTVDRFLQNQLKTANLQPKSLPPPNTNTDTITNTNTNTTTTTITTDNIDPNSIQNEHQSQ